MANIKIISIDPASTFTGKNGEDVAAQRLWVEISGPIRVAAYGTQVDLIKIMNLSEGDEVMGLFRKAPSVTLG